MEHPFAPYVRILGKGKKGARSLTAQEAYDAMSMILAGQVTPEQLGAFMMLLRVKEESAEELLGFTRATRDFINPPGIAADIDWSSYAGKRHHLPWYVLAALLLADSGKRVFLQGAAGHTEGRLYTEEVFTSLGLPVASSWDQVENALDAQGIVYMPLSAFCAPLQHIIDLRNQFGLRSPVHTLARLINPLNATYVLQGIFHPSYRGVHQEAAQALGYRHVAVIKGEAGETERKPDATCLVQQVIDGKLQDEEWPRMMSGRSDKESDLAIETLAQVWRGERDHPYGIDAITGTVAIALKLMAPERSQEQAMEDARHLWAQRNRHRL